MRRLCSAAGGRLSGDDKADRDAEKCRCEPKPQPAGRKDFDHLCAPYRGSCHGSLWFSKCALNFLADPNTCSAVAAWHGNSVSIFTCGVCGFAGYPGKSRSRTALPPDQPGMVGRDLSRKEARYFDSTKPINTPVIKPHTNTPVTDAAGCSWTIDSARRYPPRTRSLTCS